MSCVRSKTQSEEKRCLNNNIHKNTYTKSISKITIFLFCQSVTNKSEKCSFHIIKKKLLNIHHDQFSYLCEISNNISLICHLCNVL